MSVCLIDILSQQATTYFYYFCSFTKYVCLSHVAHCHCNFWHIVSIFGSTFSFKYRPSLSIEPLTQQFSRPRKIHICFSFLSLQLSARNPSNYFNYPPLPGLNVASWFGFSLFFRCMLVIALPCRRASSGREGIHSKNRSIILYLLIIKTHFCPRQRLVYPVQFLLPVLGGQKSHFTQAQMILLASLIYLPKSKKNLFKNPFSVMYTEAPKIQSSPCKRD